MQLQKKFFLRIYTFFLNAAHPIFTRDSSKDAESRKETETETGLFASTSNKQVHKLS